MERRLAAILATDVVGYSRLMGEAEAETLQAINSDRNELIDPKSQQYHGRTVLDAKVDEPRLNEFYKTAPTQKYRTIHLQLPNATPWINSPWAGSVEIRGGPL